VSDNAHLPAARPPGFDAAPLGQDGPAAERCLEVRAERLLQDWKEAHARALAYLDALGLPEGERGGLATDAVGRALLQPWGAASDAVGETLRAVRALIRERRSPARRSWEGADDFLAWRLDRALSPAGEAPANLSTTPVRAGGFRSMPGLSRRAMLSEPIERRLFGRRRRERVASAPADRALYGRSLRRLRRRLSWTRVAHRRRLLLGALVLIPTTVASGFMVNVLPDQGRTWLESAIVVFFGALFGWISIGFWTAILGFFTLVRRRDRFAITSLDASAGGAQTSELDPGARTAIKISLLSFVVLPLWLIGAPRARRRYDRRRQLRRERRAARTPRFRRRRFAFGRTSS